MMTAERINRWLVENPADDESVQELSAALKAEGFIGVHDNDVLAWVRALKAAHAAAEKK